MGLVFMTSTAHCLFVAAEAFFGTVAVVVLFWIYVAFLLGLAEYLDDRLFIPEEFTIVGGIMAVVVAIIAFVLCRY